VLETFLRYHHEQGLSRRRLAPEALFAKETLESFKIQELSRRSGLQSGLDPADSPGLEHLVRLALLQVNEHALVVLGADRTVSGWLMGAEKIFGYSAQAMVGGSIDRLFTLEDRRLGIPAVEFDTAARQGLGEDDRWMVRRDGARIFIAGTLSRLSAPSGELAGFCKIMRDRSDARSHMEHFRQQALRLEAEDRRKSVLLDTLAHELRTPLAALFNASELIDIATRDHAQLADTTRLIRRQVKYLQSLVDDLIETGRVRAAKVKLSAEQVDLRGVVEAAVESCSAMLRERSQRAEILMPPIPLEGDPVRLRQVFVNLVSNASKFSSDRTIIWIKGTTEGDEAVVRVEDEGHGIAAELLPRVFDLFTQGADADVAPGAGLGLGLALVKDYVELHGGQVQVRSDGQGRGSEFIVRLPLSQPKP